MFSRILSCLVLLGVFQLISGKGCDPNPCLNGGICKESSSSSSGYECQCQPENVGVNCGLPPPAVQCGKKAIEVEIDERIIEEMDLPMEEANIYFDKSPGCRAVKKNNLYHLRVDAPFVDCGLSLKMEEENFVFSQKVIWNTNNGFVERPVVIVDFKCSYSGRYNVTFDPIKPTVTTVDFATTYGRFTLQMGLFKSQNFEEKFNLRPVVAVDDEVCIKNEISGSLPETLVLTTLRCWGSKDEDGTGDNYDIIRDRCLSDPTNSILLNNGDSSDMKFCFDVFKWSNSLESIYINCKVEVCNSTTETCYCPTGEERRKRDAEEQSEINSAKISSQKIMIVESKYFNNWLDFLETEDSNAEYESDDNGDGDYENTSQHLSESSNRPILLAIGIVLVLVIVSLGVLAGVVVSYTKKKKMTATKTETAADKNGYDVFA